jgi:hypothetical protein
MTKEFLGVFLFLVSGMTSQASYGKDLTLYDRVDARLRNDPRLAKVIGHPAKEMSAVAWMVGIWDIATTVEARRGRAPEKGRSEVRPVLGGVWLEIRDTYPQGNQDISYLGFDPVSRRWISTTVDGVGNAVTNTAARWEGDKLVFIGDIAVVGERATLRQTVLKASNRAYTVTNEERMRDGRWVLLDTYRYTKRSN